MINTSNKFNISIHALRGEGDRDSKKAKKVKATFQSTPSVGRATLILTHSTITRRFQSTPSVGRATKTLQFQANRKSHFNPRPPWGGRQVSPLCRYVDVLFQSTPSVGRATPYNADNATTGTNFNPRPPWGGRQGAKNAPKSKREISIHALRGEGDSMRFK